MKQIKINLKMILDLNASDSFKKRIYSTLYCYYKDFDSSLEEFFKLDKISFKDKVSVAVKIIDTNTCVKFSVKCAEYVLNYVLNSLKKDCIKYEKINNCIEFLNSIEDFDKLNKTQLKELKLYKKEISKIARDANYYCDNAKKIADKLRKDIDYDDDISNYDFPIDYYNFQDSLNDFKKEYSNACKDFYNLKHFSVCANSFKYAVESVYYAVKSCKIKCSNNYVFEYCKMKCSKAAYDSAYNAFKIEEKSTIIFNILLDLIN